MIRDSNSEIMRVSLVEIVRRSQARFARTPTTGDSTSSHEIAALPQPQRTRIKSSASLPCDDAGNERL